MDDESASATRAGQPVTTTASAHLLRFGAALGLVLVVALASVALEQRRLALAREFSLETFRADRLQQQINQLELQIEQLQSPLLLKESTAAGTPDRPTRTALRSQQDR